jgi:RimJ/RimL family protein N-acetyltransferase
MIDPRPVVLEGHGVRLEPLVREHAAQLGAAAADGDVWKIWYVSASGLAPGKEQGWVDAALANQDAGREVPWVVRDLSTDTIVGSTRFHDIVKPIDRVEIGYTFYGANWQRTHVNTACKLLLLGHAFDTLGCAVVGFRVDNLNQQSQTAVSRLGAKLDGVLRHFAIRADGSARDVYLYSILAGEWPAVRGHLEARLERHRNAKRSTG